MIETSAGAQTTACAGIGNSAAAECETELSIVMPCLNEAETVGICVRKAAYFLKTSAVNGEIVVADNGSTDRSREIAAAEGATIVPVESRGYGAALLGGIRAAKGRFVVMGDADDSYDFSSLGPFLEKLRAGADLVMGNRFRGKIEPGAMPFLHRYLGNPVLSFLGQLFFGVTAGDFHCGLRGFNRQRIVDLHLRTTGMEFASEMVVRAALAGYAIAEVPIVLRPDGRSRPPHLRTWRDGWRHLRFLLMYSPRWLFLYPGIALVIFGRGELESSPRTLFHRSGWHRHSHVYRRVHVYSVGYPEHLFCGGCTALCVAGRFSAGVKSLCFATPGAALGGPVTDWSCTWSPWSCRSCLVHCRLGLRRFRAAAVS
jgi:glycosyltransferase involved in cell wall biosynthesis